MIGGSMSRILKVASDVRQRDTLSALLFSLTLDKVLQNLDSNGNITYRLTQVHSYPDDIVLIARNMTALEEMFKNLKRREYQMSQK